MSSDVTIQINAGAVREIAHEEWVRDLMLRLADQTIVSSARRLAPVRRHGPSQHGAESIRAEAGHDQSGWHVDVSWDRAHDYMRFPNEGTSRGVRGEHFLETAVKENEQG